MNDINCVLDTILRIELEKIYGIPRRQGIRSIKPFVVLRKETTEHINIKYKV
jgi:hypothetical protein